MTKDEASQLKKLADAGYKILVSSQFVDSFVTAIYEQDNELVYDSAVFGGASLQKQRASSVTCYKEVEDWREIKVTK